MIALFTLLSLASGADLCAPRTTPLEKVEAAVLAGAPTAIAHGSAWDHKTPPAQLDRVARRFALSPKEIEALRANGFVVPARLAFSSYAWAFHELYRSQMPLYISADAIYHSVFAAHDNLVAGLERERLAPVLSSTLEAMHRALPEAGKSYPPEVAYDLDVYLTVARSLLGATSLAPASGKAQKDAAVFIEKAKKAQAMEEVELFGRRRTIDFTQMTPRGHYAGDEKLEPYFRGAMWLARLEFNLVSRSCRSSQPGPAPDASETPREAVDALALADLAGRAKVMNEVATLDEAWAILAGKREDVSLEDLARLTEKAHLGALTIPESAARLRAAIGDRFRRTVRLHFMPEGTTELPAIATFLGPRVVADTSALMPLVEPEVSGRHVVGAGDVAYALGHDRGVELLAQDLKRFPNLLPKLGEARNRISHAPAGPDLYGAWLAAIRALAEAPRGELPTFMSSRPFADLRLGSALAAFGQLRHNYVLIAGQGYDQGGCDIPDGFVDPVPAVYQALEVYAETGADAFRRLDPKDTSGAEAYFGRLARTARVLRRISEDELAGRRLSADQLRFLDRILEMTPGSTGAEPTYTGWYFGLYGSPDEALKSADYIADYYTSAWEEKVSYLGVSGVRLGMFVIDTGGPPRVVVGPVARAFEHHGPLASRLTDESAAQMDETARSDPWAASYTLPAPPEPKLDVSLNEPSMEKPAELSVAVTGDTKVRTVTLELLDHHRVPYASQSLPVGASEVQFKFKVKVAPEALHVREGDFQAWIEVSWAGAYGHWGPQAKDEP